MKNSKLYKMSLYDILLIGVFLVSPILAFVPVWHGGNYSKEVRIYRDDRLLELQSLEHNSIISYGNVQVEIRDEKVRFLESNCPRHICVYAGWIGMAGQTVVCVPNKMLIEVTGKQGSEYHATSY